MVALLELPFELLLHVALQCDAVADVARLARTCTALHTLISHADQLWRSLLSMHFSGAFYPASACDHRAVVRALCRRYAMVLQWALPAGNAVAHPSVAQPNVVQVQSSMAALPFVYSARSLPWRGLVGFSVLVHMNTPYQNDYEIGFAALGKDGDLHRAVYVSTSGGVGRFFVGITDGSGDTSVATQPLLMPPSWRGGTRCERAPGDVHFASGDSVHFVLDADSGRVYYAVGNTKHWLLAFESGELARARDARVYVSLLHKGSSARIDRLRMPDELVRQLIALEDEYEIICAT